jgi:hypothetical protein
MIICSNCSAVKEIRGDLFVSLMLLVRKTDLKYWTCTSSPCDLVPSRYSLSPLSAHSSSSFSRLLFHSGHTHIPDPGCRERVCGKNST